MEASAETSSSPGQDALTHYKGQAYTLLLWAAHFTPGKRSPVIPKNSGMSCTLQLCWSAEAPICSISQHRCVLVCAPPPLHNSCPGCRQSHGSIQCWRVALEVNLGRFTSLPRERGCKESEGFPSLLQVGLLMDEHMSCQRCAIVFERDYSRPVLGDMIRRQAMQESRNSCGETLWKTNSFLTAVPCRF